MPVDKDLLGQRPEDQPIFLPQNKLFHPLSQSPIPAMRRRAAFIKQNAYCPHSSHNATRMPVMPGDPEERKPRSGGLAPAHVQVECPSCGIPVACCEEHLADEYESHLEICDILREINEDSHDLCSGRFFDEFEYPDEQMEEALINMSNWDTYLYTRQHRAINNERSLRQVTRLLTYPVTIGSVIHELSPYNIRSGGRLTPEGLRSMSALRYNLHPPKDGSGGTIIRPKPPPVRVFVLGARGESSLPRDVWLQLPHMFQRSTFHLIFIGPESMTNRDHDLPLPEATPLNPFRAVIEGHGFGGRMKISTFVEYYHTLHKAGVFHPFDPYFDCFVLFHPGLGHPVSSREWAETLPLLLETKVPVISTGYTEWDMQRDWKWVNEQMRGEVDMLLEPGENRFRSLRWDMNDLDPQDISCANWGVWAFRGKRYEATTRDESKTE
ncbi:zinc-finger of mitochondrial splicing suppressor 51-domain-containing protein [Lineolata rhizophorae]|uniref:Zinc-finger of mitochondrial splicing suppressor 51-domain-containing protein n=1 Tax=Lineolata rhizophorae TaxID=578093 RepID=A0A6A6PDG9_9PEZI|nr:zinc-finger of mitochondrial splicing suppressor 51-domain-containing protein [Lineolata rhizophorae]